MTERIKSRIEVVTTELKQFHPPVKEPNYVVLKSIQQLTRCLASHINADSDDNPFRMQFDSLLSLFGEQLQASKLEVDMDRANDDTNPGDIRSTQSTNKSKAINHKKRSNEPASCKRLTSSSSGAAIDKVTQGLADLQLRYNRGATNSIPGSINDKVTEQLIRESCTAWKEIVAELLRDVEGLVRRMIKDSMEETALEWKHTKLYDDMQHATLDYFNTIVATEGEEMIKKHLARMHACPTTFKKSLEENNHLRWLLSARYPNEWQSHSQATSSSPDLANATLKSLFFEAIEADARWVSDRLADDKYAQMIRCVAKIHAFHDVLSSNLTDTASMQLKFDVLTTFKDESAGVLRAKLNVLDTAHCTALLAEDPAREKRRKQLLAEKTKLGQALSIVKDLEETE